MAHLQKYGYGPAVYYRFSDLDISIGLIQAIHGKFCDRCNRVRITSEAKLKPCLASAKVIDLRPALEDTENPDKLAELMRQAVSGSRNRIILRSRIRKKVQKP